MGKGYGAHGMGGESGRRTARKRRSSDSPARLSAVGVVGQEIPSYHRAYQGSNARCVIRGRKPRARYT